VLTVAVVAANTALLWFTAIVTFAGTASDPLLLLKETITALVAALLNETVQLVEELLPSVVGEQESDVSCAGALPVKVNV
jgi:hypothetical protein